MALAPARRPEGTALAFLFRAYASRLIAFRLAASFLSIALALVLALALGLSAAPAQAAQTGKAPKPKLARFLMDMTSGKVLVDDDADRLHAPASLTKMMTIYLTLEAVKTGALDWSSRVPISEHGFNTPAYKFALPVGATFTVREAVEGMIVISANDAAESMCDYLAGRQHISCGELMTRKARALGMSRSTFKNGSGLSAKGQLTTARDMGTLGAALIRDFPKDYKLFKKKYFKFRSMTLRGHNSLMYRYEGMDGLKTGFIDEAGYNLVSSAKRGQHRLVGVVLGGTSGADRADKMEAMMDVAFAELTRSGALMALAPAGNKAPPAEAKLARDAREAAAILAAPAAERTGSLPFSLKAPRSKPGQAQRGAPLPSADLHTGSIAPVSVGKTSAQPVFDQARPQDVSRSPWEVQVAAVDRPDKAMSLLASAKTALSDRFPQVSPFTETISRGAATLIRARLTGFDSKAAAVEACRVLQARAQSCFVVGS